ncbi:enoyl-CoA hydratase/isomerase family protein [Streptomyces sp. NRRL S-37]|uniref:enoyl-CoA hydratase/isomerase family protein n=1 Tax=Streptomyces sp. NRRL S-37 TaxID=1463903 RepID=UPI00068BDC6E|nr:enoyl-CoA hydratase/isomerase family protein [Streptomyces sp. NRRL S-37]
MTTQRPEVRETVTTPRPRDVRLPDGAGTLLLITLDNGLPPLGPAMRPTTFGPEGLDLLDAVLDEAAVRARRGEIAGVAVTGTAFMFSTGADLALAAGVTDREEAVRTLRRGHQVFRRLGDLPVPSFAFLNGVTIGGGLELALHCGYRTLSRGAPAVALPECSLGLVPAWGGVWLAPRLLGPDRAVTLMLEHPLSARRMLSATEAHALGLADVLLEPSRFLDRSLAWAADVLRGRHTVTRPAPEGFADQWDDALTRAADLVETRTHGVVPAPRRTLELLELSRTATRDEVLTAAEQTAADLFGTTEFRSSLYAFQLTQKHAETHPGRPDPRRARPVRSVGVVGDGEHGLRLAALLLEKLRVPVAVCVPDPAARDAATGELRRLLDEAAASGRIPAADAERCAGLIGGGTAVDVVADADAVVAALPGGRPDEDDAVLRQAEGIVSEDCVLLVTGGRTVADVAAGLKNPGRVVGLALPTAGSGAVELTRAGATDTAYATAGTLAARLGLPCLPVGDHPGSVADRLRTAFADALLERAREEDLDAVCAPLALPTPPSVLCRRLRRADVLAGPAQPPADTAHDALDHALAALARDIGALVADGTLAGPADADLMLLASGEWPFHLGGVTPYLDRSGIAARVTGGLLGERR